jgi:hypothetical protein
MGSTKSFPIKKACLLIPLSAIMLCLIGVAASVLSNLGLPQHSTTLDHLNKLEKARLSEVLHLRSVLGDSVWSGWS